MSFLPWVTNFLHTFVWIGICLTIVYIGVREVAPMWAQFLVYFAFSLVVKYAEQALFGTWEHDNFFGIPSNFAYVLGLVPGRRDLPDPHSLRSSSRVGRSPRGWCRPRKRNGAGLKWAGAVREERIGWSPSGRRPVAEFLGGGERRRGAGREAASPRARLAVRRLHLLAAQLEESHDLGGRLEQVRDRAPLSRAAGRPSMRESASAASAGLRWAGAVQCSQPGQRALVARSRATYRDVLHEVTSLVIHPLPVLPIRC